jgi:hypothetical protein
MEPIIESLVTGKTEAPGQSTAPGIAGPVKAAVRNVRLLSPVLHYVYLTTGRPTDILEIGTEQPESRPDTLTHREPDPGFETSAGLVEEIACIDPA